MSLPVIDVPKYTTDLPSTGQKVTYRPFIVKEQKQLLMAVNGDASEQVAAVEDIISACTFGKVNPTKLPAFDLEHLFFCRVRFCLRSYNNHIVFVHRYLICLFLYTLVTGKLSCVWALFDLDFF